MKKIVVTKWNRRICPHCGTMFDFEPDDIDSKFLFQTANQYRYKMIVECPVCNTDVFLCSDFYNMDSILSIREWEQIEFFSKNHNEVIQDILNGKYDDIISKKE